MVNRTCEYFSRVWKDFIYCEAARLRFKDKNQRNEYCSCFCNKADSENKCPIKQSLDEFYKKNDSNDL